MTTSDISEWIDNDEALYVWWVGSRLSKTAFIKQNRVAIRVLIQHVTSGIHHTHYLKYGAH
jgi:hypothetical protein